MMAETGKSSKNYLIAAGLVIAVIAAIVALSITSGQ
ncbi:MAG: LPXTG cell wall anchor domain-containing protein [SAR324 cluster bacterium]|nr:LPXTG cell wall anchor domain-containing protein [SAR324 cluster bacterium]